MLERKKFVFFTKLNLWKEAALETLFLEHFWGIFLSVETIFDQEKFSRQSYSKHQKPRNSFLRTNFWGMLLSVKTATAFTEGIQKTLILFYKFVFTFFNSWLYPYWVFFSSLPIEPVKKTIIYFFLFVFFNNFRRLLSLYFLFCVFMLLYIKNKRLR